VSRVKFYRAVYWIFLTAGFLALARALWLTLIHR